VPTKGSKQPDNQKTAAHSQTPAHFMTPDPGAAFSADLLLCGPSLLLVGRQFGRSS
jgi:hypothetical protein